MTLSKTAIASFDVDAQKSFTPLCPNELPVVGGDQIGAELNYMASLVGHRIGSKDAHTPNAPWVVQQQSDMMQATGLEHADLTWVSHCVPGTPGFELLDELRFERAKQLLAEKHHAIYQIAEELGFSESASFRHAFQRWSGVPPSQFRH